jgi:hypothetical protein
MSNSQPELDLDTWWLQTDLDDFAVSGRPDTYVPSLSDWLIEANQHGNMMQSPEAGYQYGEQVDRGSMGLQQSSIRWDQTSIGCDNATPVRSIASEDKQDWSQLCGRELDQFMRTFEQDMGLQQHAGLRSLQEPLLGETSFSGYVGSGFLDDQDTQPDDQDSSLQTFDADDQVSQRYPTITTIDRQRGPREGRKKDNLDSVEPMGRRADQLPRRGRPPRRCILKQIDDACFSDTDGKLVSALVMQAVKDVAVFLECSHSTISKAMAQTDERKGIVFNIWKVEEYTNREADEDVRFTVQNEQDSCHEQQPHIEIMASTLNYACTHELATNHSAVCVNDLASSHPEQYISLASSPKEQYSHHSEMTDRYATHPNELFLEVSDFPSLLKPSNVSE